MIYENELVRYKPNKVGLQIFAAQYQPKRPKTDKYRKLLEHTAGENSSVHGVRYIWAADEKRQYISFLWATVVISALAGSIVMYLTLSHRHNQQNLKTIVETSQYPVYRVDFPAVAICPFNHVNWLRVKSAEERFLPPQPSVQLLEAFHDMLLALEGLDFSRFDQLSNARKLSLHQIDGVSVTELAQLMAFRCDEILSDCMFDEMPADCCKLFVAERTRKGVCMVFNSMISEESKKKKLTDENYPYNIGKAGEGTGLKFTIRRNDSYIRPGNELPFAMNLMIKRSEHWNEGVTQTLRPDTHNSITIRPQITETSANTRGMPPQKRFCLFSDEHWNKYEAIKDLPHNRYNCHTQCMQHHIIKICNCTIPLFLPTTVAKHRECAAWDFICLYDNRDIFSYVKGPNEHKFIEDKRPGMMCDCLDSCYSIIYLAKQNVRRLQRNRTALTIMVDIHYGQRMITKYSTRLEYTLMDLLANFGGILGLFLGASVLSFAEMLYILIKLALLMIGDRRVVWRKVRGFKLKLKLKFRKTRK